MKVSRILAVLALAGFGATVAMADGVDPTVVIRRVDPPPVAITSPDQTFSVTATSTHNVFAFQNDTSVILTSLTLDLFAGSSGLVYSCGSFAGADIFANCSSSSGGHHDTIVSFFGVGGSFSGITPATCTFKADGDDDDQDKKKFNDDDFSCTGGIYSLEFDGIPAGAVVRGDGTVAAPEPVTAVLLMTGLVGLAGLRKRRIS